MIRPHRRHWRGRYAESTLADANDLLGLWRRFLDTRCGFLLAEHTPLVRRLSRPSADGHDPESVGIARRALGALVLTPCLPAAVLGLSAGCRPLIAMAFALLIILGAAAIVFWKAYDGSAQQEADRLDADPNLLGRAGIIHRLSGRAISLAADRALPATRARLDQDPVARGMPIGPRANGMLLGYGHGVGIWISAERPVMVVTPPRQGKTTSVVIPLVMEAPGPVVVTSSRRDVLDATLSMRRDGFDTMRRPDFDRRTPSFGGDQVHVFDPTGILDGVAEYAPYAIHWDPVARCREPRRAEALASALVGGAGLGREDRIWQTIGVDIAKALLLAAGLEHKSMRDVYAWSQSMTGMNTALRILANHPQIDACAQWARPLEQLGRDDARTRANKLLTLAGSMSVLSQPRVQHFFGPTAGPSFDMAAFLRSRGTVYILSELHQVDGESAGSAAGLTGMFLADLRDEARSIALHTAFGRLEPPVTLVLDEAGNIAPWPGLPQLFTAGTGEGIWPVAVFQSRKQAEAAFRRDEPQMWEAAQKIILGGLAEDQTLQTISHLTGQTRRHTTDRSLRTNPFGLIATPDGLSTTEHGELRPVLSPDEIRRLPPGRALLITHSIQAVNVQLIPYWQRGWTPRNKEPDSAHTD
jgi:type IV secretory pathway TraG/TraD family ATPase VirD4